MCAVLEACVDLYRVCVLSHTLLKDNFWEGGVFIFIPVSEFLSSVLILGQSGGRGGSSLNLLPISQTSSLLSRQSQRASQADVANNGSELNYMLTENVKHSRL